MSLYRFGLAVVLVIALGFAGCGLTDPERPTSQPDAEVFGEITEIRGSITDGEQVVVINVGMPAALKVLRTEEGKGNPSLEEKLQAEVTVDADTVVVVDGRASALSRLAPGVDVVALPVSGTTLMYGTRRLTCRATIILDIASFQMWKMPVTLDGEALEATREDPARINSDGVERAPVVADDGRVLYFTAKLRRPWEQDGAWSGAARTGLVGGDGARRVQTYRTELGQDGWSAPELVQLPGLEDVLGASVTWVAQDETACLVTAFSETSSWIGRSERAAADRPWGEVERLELPSERVSDGVYLAGSTKSVAFTGYQDGRSTRDLFLLSEKDGTMVAKPLAPVINTVGDEWCPRVGPDNELFFNRQDRQLQLVGGAVNAVRPPGETRVPITECNPTHDGRWMFCVVIRYTPVELDRDIAVASWDGERLGEPVMVDDWRP